MNSLLSVHYIIWLVISTTFTAFGEYLSKKFASEPHWYFFVGLLVAYTLGVLAWLPAIMQKNQLTIAGAIWSVLLLVMTVVIGVLIFGEKLNMIGGAGILLAAVAIFLLSIA